MKILRARRVRVEKPLRAYFRLHLKNKGKNIMAKRGGGR